MQMGNISLLPEDCIANFLSFTSPRDACAFSLVSSTIKSAADSDVVWEKFLPSDYKHIISRSVSWLNLNNLSSKKELYKRLCGDPVLLDGGNKSFNLERKSGKKCFMIGSKTLTISGGDSPNCWNWISHVDSRFAQVVELKGACWIQISGNIETKMLSPKTTYVAYLVVKYTNRSEGLDYPPVEAIVEFVAGVGNASGAHYVYLKRGHGLRRRSHRLGHRLRPTWDTGRSTSNEVQFPSEREDGWLEIELGELYNTEGEDGEVQMSMQEVKGGHWKSGLIVEGIELRPKKDST